MRKPLELQHLEREREREREREQNFKTRYILYIFHRLLVSFVTARD